MKAKLRQELHDIHQMPFVCSATHSFPYVPLDQLCDPTQEFEAFQPEKLDNEELNLILISKDKIVMLANGIDFDISN